MFLCSTRPVQVHDIFNETLTLITILSIWAIGLIFSLPFLIFAKYDPLFNPTDIVNNTDHLITVCYLNASTSLTRTCITWFIVILIFIPFFVLTYIYARIICELVRHRAVRLRTVRKSVPQYDEDTNSLQGGLALQNDQQASSSFLSYKRFEQKRLNTVIICVVTVAFFACQFPVRIIQLLDMYLRVRNPEVLSPLAWIWTWKLSKLLFFLNFTANPVSGSATLARSLIAVCCRSSTTSSRRSSVARADATCRSTVR